MSDIKLFHVHTGQATELQGSASDLEKPLQPLNAQSQERSMSSLKSKGIPYA